MADRVSDIGDYCFRGDGEDGFCAGIFIEFYSPSPPVRL